MAAKQDIIHPTHAALVQKKIDAINAITIPTGPGQAASLWKLMETGEVADSETMKRAFGKYDILNSPYIIPDLLNRYQNLLPVSVRNMDNETIVTYLMAILSLKEIADFFGY
tara:strand:- start:95 stop:430 length:336 start_codon:yes stop_codon:yes gene_type:complete